MNQVISQRDATAAQMKKGWNRKLKRIVDTSRQGSCLWNSNVGTHKANLRMTGQSSDTVEEYSEAA